MRISFARRSSRFSLDHGCVRPFSRSPRDRPSSMSASRPAPVRLRPEAELVCHRGDLTGIFPGLDGELADAAHGVLVLSGGVAQRRRAFRAPVAGPALWAVVSWLLLSPKGKPSRGTSSRHPRHGRRLEVRDVLPGPPSRAEDELGFVEGVHALGECVVIAVPDRTDGGDRADLCQTLAVANASVLGGLKGSLQHRPVGGSVGDRRRPRLGSSIRGSCGDGC